MTMEAVRPAPVPAGLVERPALFAYAEVNPGSHRAEPLEDRVANVVLAGLWEARLERRRLRAGKPRVMVFKVASGYQLVALIPVMEIYRHA